MPFAFFVCDEARGKILRTGLAPDSRTVLAQERPGERAFIQGNVHDGADWFNWEAMQVQKRPAMPGALDKETVIANGLDPAILSGLPNPAEVRVHGPLRARQFITDGELVLTFDLPGTYSVEVRAFPYLDRRFEIVATEP